MVRVKVCCIGSVEEARRAVDAGASAVGLVSAMPSGPGVIDDERIAQIAAAVPASVRTFLLTSRTDPGEIMEQVRAAGVDTVQLCDTLAPGSHGTLREELPGVSLVQVVHVVGEDAVEEALQAAPGVDALLLDSGNPALDVKELGGTGRTHDWALSARIVEDAGVPVYLAGGLTAENVARAVAKVRPFGVDVCSGVRTGGRLDPGRLGAFVAAVRAG